MRKFVTSALFASAAAAAAIGLSASSASAAVWEVTNGGAISASAGQTTLVVHNAAGDVTLVCQSSDATANLPNGQSNGQPVGSIGALSFNDCILGGIFPFDVNTDGFPWNLNANSQAGSVVSGAIPGGIGADITGVGCTARVSGPANTNDGSVPATYDNGLTQLKVNGGGNLTIHDVNGCAGLIANDDRAEFFSTYTVTPGAQINLVG